MIGLVKYDRCVGVSFPSIMRRKIEIWFCPSNYNIKPHTHNNHDSKILFLFGNNVSFFRKKKFELQIEEYIISFLNIFKTMSINAGDTHFFHNRKWPLIFLNYETWKCKPASASTDLQLI